MKTSLLITLLALAAVGTHANCPQSLSESACRSYSLVENTFSRVSHKATFAIVQGILSFSYQTFDLYQTSLAALEELAAAELRKGRLSKTEADDMLRDIAVAFFNADAAKTAVTAKGMEAAALAQEEIIVVLSDAVANRAALEDTSHVYDVTGEDVNEVLRSAHQKVVEIVKKALEKVNEGWNRIEGVFEKMLKKFSTSEVFQELKRRVRQSIEKIKEKVTNEAEKEIEGEFDSAVYSTPYALSDAAGGDEDISLWTRIKNAVKNISDKVYETTKKALEEKKPEIMAALDNLGKILVSVGKKIALELVGEVVKATLA